MVQPTRFSARLRRPAKLAKGEPAWAFLVLPKAVSDTLPRRGRTTVALVLGAVRVQATLEPDGQLSHWLRLDEATCAAAGAKVGEELPLELTPVDPEPEPEVPADLREALDAAPQASATWSATTTLARLDWIHWITTAKQAKTRASRVRDAMDMLGSGKKRVCCFDPSGFYSKALKAPEEAS